MVQPIAASGTGTMITVTTIEVTFDAVVAKTPPPVRARVLISKIEPGDLAAVRAAVSVGCRHRRVKGKCVS